MKLIPESNAFEAVNQSLNFDTVQGRIVGRLESYSCKLVGHEKALYKKFSSSVTAGMNEMEILSPSKEEGELPSSPLNSNSFDLLYRTESTAVPSRKRTTSLNFPQSHNLTSNSSSSSVSCSVGLDSEGEGSICEEDRILRKTLFYLVSTLNASFYPDYDFSCTSASEFSKEHSLQHVMTSIERQLRMVSHSDLTGVCGPLWMAIDESVQLKNCEIYTYTPDETSDPYSDDGCLWSFNYFFYNTRLKRIVFLTCQLLSNDAVQNPESDYDMDFDDDY